MHLFVTKVVDVLNCCQQAMQQVLRLLTHEVSHAMRQAHVAAQNAMGMSLGLQHPPLLLPILRTLHNVVDTGLCVQHLLGSTKQPKSSQLRTTDMQVG